MARPDIRSEDFSQRAHAVVQHIIEKYDDVALTEDEPEPQSVSAGRKGGLARAAAMTPEERSASARRAARARWEKTPAG